MKKICCILLLILVCSLFLLNPVVSFAQEPTASAPDSFTIPNDIKAQMDLTDSDQVVRVFSADVISLFWGEEKTIESCIHGLLKKEIRKEYYLVMNGDQVLRTYENSSKDGFRIGDDPRFESLIEWIPKEVVWQESIRRVAEDVVVNSCYILADGTGMGNTGWMIYFDTNYGPYVFYDYVDQYLMPYTAYLQMTQDFSEIEFQSGFRSILHIDNFEKKYGHYNLNSDHFSLTPPVPTIVWVVVAILPITAAVGIGWYVKKRKSRKEGEL